eukprot:Skav214319  [mRNA]  locus=scaffold86:15330:18495:+ [translate_table: standard]
MWRDPGNPKTMLHYAIPERDVLRNRLRAASAWMGPWIQKVQTFQEFHSIETGSLDHFDHVKRRLNCGTFQDYLRRFEDLFVGTGMLPSTIFHLKDTNGRCLTLDLYTKQLYLHDCIEDFEGQVWQRSNSISSEDLQCCGGLKLWNYNYCLAWYGADVQVAGCSFFGGSSYQDFGLGITETGEAMIGAPSLEGEQHCLSSGTLVSGVSLEVHLNHSLATLELVGPGIFRVVTKSRLCLVSLEGHLGLAFGSCASAAELQVVGESEGRKQLQVTKVEGRGQCLDAAQGTGIYLYPCHSPEERLPNQVFIAEEGGPLCWPFGDAEDRGQSNHLRCVSERREEPQVVLQPCANEAGHEENDKGQLFLKHLERTRESFTLSSLERDKCLVADFEHSVTVNGEEAFFLVMGTCSKSQRWVQTETAVAVELRGDLWCLAASDFRRPVVTSCWPDDLTQHFETQRVPNNRGISYFAVRKRPHWADSGRERFPALCLDVTPSPRIPVIAAPCKEQALWTMEWEEVPLETQLFEASESERLERLTCLTAGQTMLTEANTAMSILTAGASERSSALAELARSLGGDFELLPLDLMDEEALSKAIQTLRPSVIFHAGGIFRRCEKPIEEMVKPNIAMAEARAYPESNAPSCGSALCNVPSCSLPAMFFYMFHVGL